MSIAPGSAQNLESARAVILLVAIALVVFWRTLVKILIMIVAIAVIATLGLGAYLLVH